MKCPKCLTDIATDRWTGGLLKCPACAEEFNPAKVETQQVSATDIAELSPTLSEILATNRPEKPEEGKVLPAGTMVGQYRIRRLIGRGGMGAVYEATHVHLDRLVAVKILPPEMSRDSDFVRRFQREARALAKLQHPNIVAVTDMGVQGDLYYFVMEFVDGVNLRHLLMHKLLSPEQALALAPRLCEALEYAHSQGVVHRDIKPENILIGRDGSAKIADFGLAKVVKGETGPSIHTQTNVVMGTADYMAPEQRQRTASVDHRADIYSMGVVLYEMLTGELPVGRFPPPSKRVQVDVRLDGVVLRALEHDPQLRYQRASDMGQDVTKITSGVEPAGAQRLDLGRCLNDAISVYRNDWLLMTVAGLVSSIVTVATVGLLSGAMGGGFALLGIRALRRPDRRVEFGDLFAVVGSFLPLLVGLLVSSLGWLLIFPGVMWMFTVYFMVDRRRGPIEALGDSWNAVKQVGFGTCMLLWLVLILFSLGPNAIPYIGPVLGIFIAPLVSLMTTSAYLQITRGLPEPPAPLTPEAVETRKRTHSWVAIVLVAACLMMLAFCALAAIGLAVAFSVRARQEQSRVEESEKVGQVGTVPPALDGALWASPMGSSPAVAVVPCGDDLLAVASNDAIRLVLADSGAVNVTLAGGHGMPVFLRDGRILAPRAGSASIAQFSPRLEGGWSITSIDLPAPAATPLATDGATVYVGTTDGHLLSVGSPGGWNVALGSTPAETVCFAGHVAYAAGGHLEIVRADNGERTAGDIPLGGGRLVGAGDAVAVVGPGEVRFYRPDGRPLERTFSIAGPGAPREGSPLFFDGRSIVYTSAANAVGINADFTASETGSMHWTLIGEPVAPAIPVGGHLMLAMGSTDSLSLTELETGTGMPRSATAPLPGRGDRPAFLAARGNRLYVLDAASAELRAYDLSRLFPEFFHE